MPELPEVETVVRGLAAMLPGRRIVGVEGVAPVDLIGQQIVGVSRLGKFIRIDLDQGPLFFHLGMTGQLTLSAEVSPYTRARLQLDEGVLRFDDIRKFGRVVYGGAAPRRGPDALAIACDAFVALLKGRRRQVKALLLDQSVLSGMGNIYTDEALFRAGIHPRAIAARLSRARLEGLWREMQAVLTAAIAAGGSSISDYVDARGERGGFQTQHRVYGRAGQPCLVCGTVLERMLVAQRGTSFCPRCQRR